MKLKTPALNTITEVVPIDPVTMIVEMPENIVLTITYESLSLRAF